MAVKIPRFFFLLIVILAFISPTSMLRHHHHHRPRRRHHDHQPPAQPPGTVSPSRLQPPVSTTMFFSSFPVPFASTESTPAYNYATVPGGGYWTMLQKSIGVSAMHMQLLHNNKVIIFDRTDFGPSNLTLSAGRCRYNDEAVPVDCTAHSVLYDVVSNTYRPLMVQTDVWCSSGAVNSQGLLIQTGGYHAGDKKIRLFAPCDDEQCDWMELTQNLTTQRWYASDHILPDGRVIVVGGRRAFSYEFFPQSAPNNIVFQFPFLMDTTDPKEENNLYPFLYILPDGNLFVFANQRSIILDYKNNQVVREFPEIPGEKRSYPAAGSSVMLPLTLIPGQQYAFPAVEIMVCGGANGGAYMNALRGQYWPASKTCGRIRITDSDPKWEMEEMPMGRVMPDMLLLPTGDVIIINGAGRGTAGWECAIEPVMNPVLYTPGEPDPDRRFSVLNPSGIGRMYHSAAILLPDGRILVGGSNPHARYNFTGVEYPTELSLEAFSPPYLSVEYSQLRPSVLSIEGTRGELIVYGQQIAVTFSLGLVQPPRPWGEYAVTLVVPSFTTHSFAMNQRMVVLYVAEAQQLSAFTYKLTAYVPPTSNVAPPGYYMLFVVHQGVPSNGVWIRIGYV